MPYIETIKNSRKGMSYLKRVQDVNAIYDEYIRKGCSNRYIWKNYVYPLFGICERTFYNYLKHGCWDSSL